MNILDDLRRIYPFVKTIEVEFKHGYTMYYVHCPTLMGGTHGYSHPDGADYFRQCMTGQIFKIGAPAVTLEEALRS